MPDLKYYWRRISHIDLSHLRSALDKVQEKTGRSRAGILLDMTGCFLKYGAGYYDYLIFALYDRTPAQRKTYFTRGISRKFNRFMNDEAYTHLFDNKDEFNKLFSRYIRRGWLVLPESTKEEVRAFVEGKDEVFVKISDGECSHGCERIRLADWPDFDALYAHLREGGFGLLEDVVDQHPDVEALHPGSVNCLRVITIIGDDGVPRCMYAAQKMGMGDSVVDCNCLFSRVDPETGRILYPGHSGDTPRGVIYPEHPDTHIPLPGYQLPFVPEAVAMCLEAALVVPQVRYVGWDVALSKEGPEFIEGNTYCAHDFWQLPPHTPDGIGMLPAIREAVPSFRC